MGSGLVNVDVGGFFSGLFGIASEFIEDKDKRNEFNMKIAKFESEFNLALITQKTHPWIDAFVKLLFAINTLWRPLGGAGMTAFGIYASVKGIELDPALRAVLIGAFPAWGASRHISKIKGVE